MISRATTCTTRFSAVSAWGNDLRTGFDFQNNAVFGLYSMIFYETTIESGLDLFLRQKPNLEAAFLRAL